MSVVKNYVIVIICLEGFFLVNVVSLYVHTIL